ncbi:unnamed protein product [Heligmosomoides polygyrus]|uniref:Uncharacterized protein n=1 Tax=Heligmosomoides polygyrus TaxID=6339 RepID=A0A183FQI5_HELPZ|nr:unnamed protein product [Heligmosomoides polygyrus]
MRSTENEVVANEREGSCCDFSRVVTDKEAAVISRVWLPTVTIVDETWKKTTDTIRQAAQSELGNMKPRRRKVLNMIIVECDEILEMVAVFL